MKENLPFDDFVKTRLSHFEPDVPPRIWQNILAEKRDRKPKGFWINTSRLLLVSALLLTAAISAYFLYKNKRSDNPTDSAKHEISNTSTPDVAVKNLNSAAELSNISKLAESPVDESSEPAPGIRSLSQKGENHQLNSTAWPSKVISPNGSLTGKSPKGSNPDLRNAATSRNDIIVYDENDNSGLNENSKTLNRNNFIFELRKMRALTTGNQVSKTPRLQLPDCPTIEKNAAGNKKYLEAYAGPDYVFNNYKSSFGDSASVQYAEKRKSATSFASAFSIGARYTKVFNNGMSVRSGVNFSQINEKFKYINPAEIRFVTIITTRVIVRAPGDTIFVNDTLRYQQSGTRVKTTSNRYRNIDIPLVIGYELGNGKLHANINAGAIINLYSWYKGEVLDTTYQPVSITTGKGNSQYQFKTNIGVGFISSISVYYKLNDKLHLMVEPYFRYNFSPISKESLNIQQRYQTAGIRAGLRLDLGQQNQ